MELRLRNATLWASLPRRRVPGAEPLPPEEAEGQPHLWRWVNPNHVCPIAARPRPEVPGPAPAQAPGRLRPPPPPLPAEEAAVPRAAPGPAARRRRALRWRGRRARGGGWPPPPLHYCLLISLALRSSARGSLAVQEIYQFARQHFPFFRTAPDGWKNTIRHNLCFSSSFQKSADVVCLEGNRKARLWQLTPEGRARLRQQLRALSEAQRRLLRQSTDSPELLRSLLGVDPEDVVAAAAAAGRAA